MFTVKQAAEAVGVRPATLRAWDRRHGIGGSGRSAAGYRQYDHADLERLRTLRDMVATGWGVGQAAALLRAGDVSVQPLPDPLDLAEAFLRGDVEAATIGRWVQTGHTLGTFTDLMDTWMLPLMRRLAEAWTAERVAIERQHELVFELSRRLMSFLAHHELPPDAPRALLGIPEGSRHSLGALAFAVSAAEGGLRTTYLAAMPMPDWRRALRLGPVRTLALAVPCPGDVPAARSLLGALVEDPRLQAVGVTLAVGGPAHAQVGDLAHPLGHGSREAVTNLARLLGHHPEPGPRSGDRL